MAKKKCVICGKLFTTELDRIVCCSKECSKKWSNARQAKYAGMYVKHPTTQKYGRGGENYEAIADIAIAARKEGLTYGQYVAKYGNDAWRRANGIDD